MTAISTLSTLAREAAALADGQPAPPDRLHSAETDEVARVLQICNACRYCEGFCAVFPAMTRRLQFNPADAHYLANLCHNCGACLHACQYAPPHAFAVNVPQTLARVRLQTYSAYAWPAPLGALYRRQGLLLSLAVAAMLALFLLLAARAQGSLWAPAQASSFYAVFPHNTMVALFAPVFGFALLALGIGLRRFWRDEAPGPVAGPAAAEATAAVLGLRYLGGGHGDGCNNADDAFSLARRHAHHATFYGFALCFAATSVATLYHVLGGWAAPYAYTSLPKLLGLAGGLLMVGGTAALWRLKRTRDPQHGDAAQSPMDLGFIALLFGVAASGLLLTAARATPALALLLAGHLGLVMALFATLPYSKFAHGFYRSAALLKFAVEKRQPSTLKLGDD